MPLNWNVENVKNYKTVCFNTYTKEGSVIEQREMDPKTQALIFFMAHVGHEITEKNWEETFIRMHMWEQAYGAFCSTVTHPGKREDCPFTPLDIYQHIGLKANWSLISKAQFKSQLMDGMRWDALGELKRNPVTKEERN